MKTNAMTEPPTLRELNALIPRELRLINPWKSLAYLAFSMLTTALCVAAAVLLLPPPANAGTGALLLWTLASVAIGVAASGLWVLGHECGHGSFIRPVWLEQLIGLALHTFFLAPYFSWRRTHQMHHLRTNHVGEDIAYVPFAPDSGMGRFQARLKRLFGGFGFNVMFQFSAFIVGFPVYLCVGLPGKMAWVSHFIPRNKAVYPTAKIRWLVFLNSLLYFSWLGLVVYLCTQAFAWMLFLFVLPVLVVNFWLIFYTLHHHVSSELPWYDEQSWTAGKGAFAVVDRSYWPLINLLHHNIGRYHVYHHVNSAIPHYHAKQATQLIKQAYPEFFREDKRNPFVLAWQVGRHGLVWQRAENHHYWLG